MEGVISEIGGDPLREEEKLVDDDVAMNPDSTSNSSIST